MVSEVRETGLPSESLQSCEGIGTSECNDLFSRGRMGGSQVGNLSSEQVKAPIFHYLYSTCILWTCGFCFLITLAQFLLVIRSTHSFTINASDAQRHEPSTSSLDLMSVSYHTSSLDIPSGISELLTSIPKLKSSLFSCLSCQRQSPLGQPARTLFFIDWYSCFKCSMLIMYICRVQCDGLICDTW